MNELGSIQFAEVILDVFENFVNRVVSATPIPPTFNDSLVITIEFVVLCGSVECE